MTASPWEVMDDGALADLARAGCEDAFVMLMRRYTPLLMGFLYGKLHNESDMEDLSQEVWLSCYQQLGQLRDGRRLSAWLMRIARNKVIDYRRAQWGRPQIAYAHPDAADGLDAPTLTAVDPAPHPAEQARRGQMHEMVKAMIAGLNDKFRVVVYLRLFHEYTTAEIAQKLGLKESAVRMRLHRGLLIVRKRIRKHGLEF